MGISRQCASKWVNRFRRYGELGLHDRSSVPRRQPTATATDVLVRIEQGGGWRTHGRGSDHAKAVGRTKTRGTRTGYVFLHTAVDGYSRLAYTEALPDEKATTAIGFVFRARAFFTAHGIDRIERIITDNGSCYRTKDFAKVLLGARHQRITPYTPRHNGKVERYNRILAEEFLYAREWTSEADRAEALGIWNIHYNYHRPTSRCPSHATGDQLMVKVVATVPKCTDNGPTPAKPCRSVRHHCHPKPDPSSAKAKRE